MTEHEKIIALLEKHDVTEEKTRLAYQNFDAAFSDLKIKDLHNIIFEMFGMLSDLIDILQENDPDDIKLDESNNKLEDEKK